MMLQQIAQRVRTPLNKMLGKLKQILPPMSYSASYWGLGVPLGECKEKIPEWFEVGRHPLVTHMVVFRDETRRREYPFFSTAGGEIDLHILCLDGNFGCRVMAVYSYQKPL